MKKHLIIFAHPNTDSFSKAMLDNVVSASEESGVNTVVRNLYLLDFNPVLSYKEIQGAYQGIIAEEVRYEQQFIQQADLITFIYPLWWMGFPAILKGYLDRILTHGFAYRTDENGSVGLLQDKKMQHFINLGSDLEQYKDKGFDQALNICLVNGLFNFCGIEQVEYELFGNLHIISNEERKLILTKAYEITRQNLIAL